MSGSGIGRNGTAGWEPVAVLEWMTSGERPEKKPRRSGRTGRKPEKLKLLAGAVLCLAALTLGKTESRAEEYTYTATFYPGNHGSFQGTEQVTVDNSSSGSSYEIEGDGDAIRISGLKAGDIVSFDAAYEGAVKLEEGSRYYVKGIRISGRDNSTVDTSAFPVEGDRDYVVAYGIQGDLTSYVVNYQDENGNTLAPSRTYYGNVGDKPVIAFRYLEGYQPQAYNLTKTLSKNEAENVFTFTYRRRPVAPAGGNEGGETGGEAGGAGTPGAGGAGTLGTGAGTAGTGAGTGTPGTGTTVVTPGGQGGAQTPENPDENQGGAAQGPENPEENQGGDAPNPEVSLPEEDVPQTVVDLDDGNVPLAEPEGGEDGSFRFPVWGSICIAVAGVAAIGLVLWFMIARRKKEKAENDES